jgi:hypothetical protein
VYIGHPVRMRLTELGISYTLLKAMVMV